MNNLQSFLEKYYSPDDKIILACSTGPDSMYLLYEILKTTYKDNLVACYFNHKLRIEADEEEIFLEKLGKKLGFQVEIGSADIKAIHKKVSSKSIEEIAREKRYQFLNAILNIHNSKYILTAHHLDDKIETFFFNLARGSKITGLINMTEQNGCILRPLLNLEKSKILNYLDENKLEYRIDKTNFDSEITRNHLRNEVIPKFGKINLNFKENINNFMSYLENVKEFIDEEVKKFLKEDGFFSLKEFKNNNLFLQKEIIRYIFFIRNYNSTIGLSESNINEIIRFINGKHNKTIKEIKNLKMKKDGDKLYY
ncbi:MAG: tRNA lysidine(34) synthetase TilS [Candidatus Gracilibacteria bacterium]